MKEWEAHLDEIKSLRDEVNWRVKVAYTASAGFISVFGAIIGIMATTHITEKIIIGSKEFVFLGLAMAGLISAFIGILNSNHATEKRIELYTLRLQKRMLKKTEEPVYNWLSFMYGYTTRKENTFFHLMEKLFNLGLALFQYAIPNILAIYILIKLFCKYSAFDKCPIFSIIISLLVLIATFSSLYLVYFVSIINKEHTQFYNNNLKKLFDDDKQNNNEEKKE